jgi:hypothetical protein
MNLQSAAEHLLATLELPPGSANVLPMVVGNEKRLVVWIDRKYVIQPRNIPKNFEGYAVKVEQRPEITSH